MIDDRGSKRAVEARKDVVRSEVRRAASTRERVSGTYACIPEDVAANVDEARNTASLDSTRAAMPTEPPAERAHRVTFGPDPASHPPPRPIPAPRVRLSALLAPGAALGARPRMGVTYHASFADLRAGLTAAHVSIVAAGIADAELIDYLEEHIEAPCADHSPILLCGSLSGRLAEAAAFARVVVCRTVHPHREDTLVRDLAVSLAEEHARNHHRHAIEWARHDLTGWVTDTLAPMFVTRRVSQVIALSALGLTQAQIGVELGIDVRTVEKHAAGFLEYVGAARLTQVTVTFRDAVRNAQRHPVRPRLPPSRASIATPRMGNPIPPFDPDGAF